jgi:hypothetical protein
MNTLFSLHLFREEGGTSVLTVFFGLPSFGCGVFACKVGVADELEVTLVLFQ